MPPGNLFRSDPATKFRRGPLAAAGAGHDASAAERAVSVHGHAQARRFPDAGVGEELGSPRAYLVVRHKFAHGRLNPVAAADPAGPQLDLAVLRELAAIAQ